MNNWIIFTLAMSQIVILYWISPRSCLAMINKILLDKNAPWVREHPDFLMRFAQPKYTVFILYAMGALWLFGLYRISGVLDDTTLIICTMMPIMVWQVVLMIYLLVAYVRIARNIPLPSKRSASLVRRNLADYVHPAWTVLCAACYLFVIGAYVVALSNQHIELAMFVSKMLAVGIVLLITVFVLHLSLRRKKNFLDEAFGASFRRWEVIANFSLSILGAAVVVLRGMISDLTSTMWVDPLSIAVAGCVLTQTLLVYLTLNSRIKKAMVFEVPAGINI